MEVSIKLKNREEIRLKPLHFNDKPEESNIYSLVPLSGGKYYIKLELRNNKFEILNIDEEVDETEESLRVRLDELLLLIDPQQASLGTEDNEIEGDGITPYDPDRIRVDTKQFSLRQIYDMIESRDINLTPDFQRNLVWDNQRKSRLIESILLRIPLPMFYFSQDEDGRIAVVDGLQRLNTVHEFMNNKFKLTKLEYLNKGNNNCENKYYSSKEEKEAIDGKYFRWFNMTQITVNVIDASSPFNLKYDIFRRINTGGQPLNAQEIRNCLSSDQLRNGLREMANLPSFSKATGNSVKDVRMEAQELALRFILFNKRYKEDKSINTYSGNIESELNLLTEELSKDKKLDMTDMIKLFDRAMLNSYHLFGEYTFRKCQPKDLIPGARKQLVNKALFVSWSVLLSKYKEESIQKNNLFKALVTPLAKAINDDYDLLSYLSFSTNSKANIQAAFNAAEKIIDKELIK
ncbi:DUF262 domain-containing protein [Chitinophaga sp. Hz27]|uniref:DUF262 domain-containing protein n=1 Tax=Chitinophaga sp. Hz27 TaxID=3347169 RepID=UPI0035E0DB70